MSNTKHSDDPVSFDAWLEKERQKALDFLGPRFALAQDQPRHDHVSAVPEPVPMFLKEQGW